MEPVAGSASSWPTPVQFALLVLAVGAFVFAVASSLKAWRLSYGHPAFDALGFRKWVMGTAVIAYMPAPAIVYVKRYFLGFVIFMLALLGLGLTIAFNPAAAP